MNERTRNGGVGSTGLLQVALIVLKLCGVINWSWWWVLSPTWMSIALAAVAATVLVIVRRVIGDE